MALPLFEELNRLRTMYLARRDPSELKVGRDLATVFRPPLYTSSQPDPEELARYHVKVRDFAYLNHTSSQPDQEELAQYNVKVRDFAYENLPFSLRECQYRHEQPTVAPRPMKRVRCELEDEDPSDELPPPQTKRCRTAQKHTATHRIITLESIDLSSLSLGPPASGPSEMDDEPHHLTVMMTPPDPIFPVSQLRYLLRTRPSPAERPETRERVKTWPTSPLPARPGAAGLESHTPNEPRYLLRPLPSRSSTSDTANLRSRHLVPSQTGLIAVEASFYPGVSKSSKAKSRKKSGRTSRRRM